MGPITIDVSDALAKLADLTEKLSVQEFQRVMKTSLGETARAAKTIIKREVVKKYEVKAGWVGQHIRPYKLEMHGYDVRCIIPISGKRGSIGGTFKTYPWKRKTAIRARIVKSGVSNIPKKMPVKTPYTGRPSFQVGAMAFTRLTDERLPIVNVKGLSAAQMPEQRARPGVEAKVSKKLEERFRHNYKRLFG